MPFGAPLELIFVKLKAPVAAVRPTALPIVDVTFANEKFVAPLVEIVTASPMVVERLPKVTVDALVVPTKFTPLPAFPPATVMAPKAKNPLELPKVTAYTPLLLAVVVMSRSVTVRPLLDVADSVLPALLVMLKPRTDEPLLSVR